MTVSQLRAFCFALLFGFAGLGLAACGDDSAQETGEMIEDTGEEVGQAMEEAGDEAEQATQ